MSDAWRPGDPVTSEKLNRSSAAVQPTESTGGLAMSKEGGRFSSTAPDTTFETFWVTCDEEQTYDAPLMTAGTRVLYKYSWTQVVFDPINGFWKRVPGRGGHHSIDPVMNVDPTKPLADGLFKPDIGKNEPNWFGSHVTSVYPVTREPHTGTLLFFLRGRDQYPGCYFYFLNRGGSDCESIDRIGVASSHILRGAFTFAPGGSIDPKKCPAGRRRSQSITIEYDLYLGIFRMVIANGTIGSWVAASGCVEVSSCWRDPVNANGWSCHYYEVCWAIFAYDLEIPAKDGKYGTDAMDHEWHDSGWTGDAYVGMLETYYDENTEIWKVPMDLKILKSCLPRAILPGRPSIPGDYVNGRASIVFKFPRQAVQGHYRIQALIAWLNQRYLNLSQSIDPAQFQSFGGNYYVDGFWYQDDGGPDWDLMAVPPDLHAEPALPFSTFWWTDEGTGREYEEFNLEFHYDWKWTPTGNLNEGTLEFFGEFPDGPNDENGKPTPGFYFSFSRVMQFAPIPVKVVPPAPNPDGPSWTREVMLTTSIPGNVIKWHLPMEPETSVKCDAAGVYTYRRKTVVAWPSHALMRYDVPKISITGPPEPLWDVLGDPTFHWGSWGNEFTDYITERYPPFYKQIAHREKEIAYGYIMRNGGSHMSDFQGASLGRETFEVERRFQRLYYSGCVGRNFADTGLIGVGTSGCVASTTSYSESFRYVSSIGLTGYVTTMTSSRGVRYKLELNWVHGLHPDNFGGGSPGVPSFLQYFFESDFPARTDDDTGEAVPEGFSDIIPYIDGTKFKIPLISKYTNPATGLKEVRDRPFPTKYAPDRCTQGITIPEIEIEVLISGIALPPKDQP